MVKDYYKISEISKLYGIGVDSLRYYEKIGVLKPRRGANGYRLYSLKEIYKLNIIKDLRKLDFSMKQIKEYLKNQSVDNTLELLEEEKNLIEKQLDELKLKQKLIGNRIETLKSSSKLKTEEFLIKKINDRFCLQLNTEITRDEEMDFAVKKLHKKHENKIHDFGNQAFGATVSIKDFNKGIYNVFHKVFFIFEKETDEYDFILPKGEYVSFLYKGSYHQSPNRIKQVLQYVSAKGYNILDDPFEIYEIDNRDTILTDEFLTEIQVRIS